MTAEDQAKVYVSLTRPNGTEARERIIPRREPAKLTTKIGAGFTLGWFQTVTAAPRACHSFSRFRQTAASCLIVIKEVWDGRQNTFCLLFPPKSSIIGFAATSAVAYS